MPKKKIALVDVDGCLIQKGKLNHELVEKLKEYDEIILFTQRGKYVQKTSLTGKVGMLVNEYGIIEETEKQNLKNQLLTTAEAVNALNTDLNNPKTTILVSTSMDPYYDPEAEQPIGSYFNNELNDFDTQLKNHLIENPLNPDNNDDINKSLKKDHILVAKINKLDIDPQNITASDVHNLYPTKKVEQYQHLLTQLSNEGQNLDDIEIDYYDDVPENLIEIRDDNDITTKPNFFVVKEKKIMDIKDKPLAQIKKETSFTSKLNKYIEDRTTQHKTEGTLFNFFRAATGASARVKISAARKLMLIVGDKDKRNKTEFTTAEKEALQEGRLGELVNAYLKDIDKAELTFTKKNKTPRLG